MLGPEDARELFRRDADSRLEGSLQRPPADLQLGSQRLDAWLFPVLQPIQAAGDHRVRQPRVPLEKKTLYQVQPLLITRSTKQLPFQYRGFSAPNLPERHHPVREGTGRQAGK